jgi:hypothetical protein
MTRRRHRLAADVQDLRPPGPERAELRDGLRHRDLARPLVLYTAVHNGVIGLDPACSIVSVITLARCPLQTATIAAAPGQARKNPARDSTSREAHVALMTGTLPEKQHAAAVIAYCHPFIAARLRQEC